ncbi:hypothetical protein AGLY_002719 [Aphis glycines]|uniref:Uncharacterized protein n=1 Tax=Aphis glycines TaxID=307491 RepID=A0A6G0U116_APHGL|nr:hypothetical protein AGLY_002719 [Aphis glycines]
MNGCSDMDYFQSSIRYLRQIQNPVTIGQAERKLKEMEHETAQLRNKFKILSLIDFEPPPPILTNTWSFESSSKSTSSFTKEAQIVKINWVVRMNHLTNNYIILHTYCYNYDMQISEIIFRILLILFNYNIETQKTQNNLQIHFRKSNFQFQLLINKNCVTTILGVSVQIKMMVREV